ncbi:MAG: tetratricopeptide repeat protein [Chloroflexi bacterium]|nr:tetratricopeptide repeat protein [Chloroflexota bacterium]
MAQPKKPEPRRLLLNLSPEMRKLLSDRVHFTGAPDAGDLEEYLRHLATQLPGAVDRVSVTGDRASLSWAFSGAAPEAIDAAVAALQRGDVVDGVVLMELLLSDSPSDTTILYNLGMAYSDLGLLERSIYLQRRAVTLEPQLANARVALGVALARQGKTEEALKELEQAVADEPDNAYAHRNLGALAAKAGRVDDAITYLRRASELNPTDQLAWYGLAQALEQSGDVSGADEAYIRTVETDEFSPVAELARQARSAIAAKEFQDTGHGAPRFDAVMYCLGALEKFEGMSDAEVQQVGAEVAMLGTKGIDVNDPTPKYNLRSLPGESSGLRLLCLEYVAFKRVAPQLDIGFDLSREYEAALALHGQRKSKEKE